MTSKYRNVRTPYGGAVYASLGEAEYAQRLDLLKRCGQIEDWKRGSPWVLVASPTGKKRDAVTYIPDFHVWGASGTFYVVDFKGVETAVFKLKARLWRAVYPDIPLLVVKRDGSERRVT